MRSGLRLVRSRYGLQYFWFGVALGRHACDVPVAHTVTVPEDYTSWKDKKLIEPTVGEILDYLEDNYHKTFILEDPTLAGKKIGGVILLDNLNDALFALSTVLNVNIIQRKDTIILKKR